MLTAHDDQTSHDPFDLARFTRAQEGVYDQALAELRRGQKETHWMWFIFPQIDGLGRSPTARQFAIKSVEEARAYLNHAVLGRRLLECSQALLNIPGKSAAQVFGFPDDLKLKSCMTLFARVSGPDSPFERVLSKYFKGQPDHRTIELLNERPESGF